MTISYLFIDSNNRDSPHSNSYTVHLTHDLQNIQQVDLVQVSVPNVVYNISNGSNVIMINGTTNYSISTGFYNAFELADALTSVLPVSCEYQSKQGTFIFTGTTSFNLRFNTPEIRKCIGINTTGNISSVSNVVVSQKIGDLSTSQSVFLDIDELRNDTLVDTKPLSTNNTYPGTTIFRSFAPIPMDVEPGYIKTFSENKDFSYSINFQTAIPRLSRLTIRWIDADGQLLNFKGYERHSFLLRVHTADRTVESVKAPDSRPQFMILGVILILIFLLVSF
jgi:hypothetical protein